jgi:hypothetical protein
VSDQPSEGRRKPIVSEPNRPPPIQPTGIFDGLRPGAILIGVIVDNLATIVAGSLLVSLFAVRLAGQHGAEPPDEAFEALLSSPWLAGGASSPASA